MHTTYEKIYIKSLQQCQIPPALSYFDHEQKSYLAQQDYDQHVKAIIYWARLKLLISEYDAVKNVLEHIFECDWFKLKVKPFTQARLKLIHGKLFYALGKYNAAHDKTQEALQQAQNNVTEEEIPFVEEDYFFCRAYMVNAKINWQLKDVYRAKLFMALSWAYYDKCNKIEGHYLPARLQCHYGQIYLQEENTEKALGFFENSEKRYKAEGYQKYFYRPETLSLFGECAIKKKEFQKAKKYILEGLSFLSDYFDKTMIRSHAHLKHLLAEVYVGLAEESNSDEQRLTYLKEASKYLRDEQSIREQLFANKEHATSARIHNFLSKVYCLKQKYDEALQEADKAIARNITEYKGSIDSYSFEEIIDQAGSAHRILVSLQRKTEVYWHRYKNRPNDNDLQLAWENIDICQQLINAIRGKFYAHDSKVNVWTYAREIFELGMEILLERKRRKAWSALMDKKLHDDIFVLFRNSKSFLLLQALHPYSMSSISGKQNKKGRYTPENLRKLMAQVNNCFTSNFQNKTFKETFILNVLESSKKDIEEEKITPSGFEQVNLQAVYNALNKEIEPGDIISYFLGDKGLYVMVIQGGNRNLQFEQLLLGKKAINELRSQIKKLAKLFNQFDRDDVKNEFPRTPTIAIGKELLQDPNICLLSYSQALYRLLWSKIKLSQGVSRLYIIPDEELFNVPFGFLTRPMKPFEYASSFSELPYLALDYKISYHISTSLLYENHERKYIVEEESQPLSYEMSPTPFQLFSIAGKLFNKDVLIGNHTSHNLRAVLKIAQSLNVDNYNDPQKGTGNDIKEQLKQVAPYLDFFHFFGHSHSDINAESSLQIEEDISAPDNNILITQAEIQHLDLKNSRLVLINACKGGDGATGNGEAPVSIFQAFLKAGARNIYYSLFTIDQSAARSFSTLFVDALMDGKSFIDAMHQTQIKLIKSGTKKSHPTIWASPSFIGNQMQVLKHLKDPLNS
ncbi:MAG: CHAT domain-containing protein [Chitinophagales bacterium]|nr:CHAT domain-containing protein [Chitinophagales bacterium]